MDFRPIYFEEKVYEELLANRKRRANSILADYYPSTRGVDFEDDVAPAIQAVHALESAYVAYNRICKKLATCEADLSFGCVSTVSDTLYEYVLDFNDTYIEPVGTDKEVSMCLHSMLKDVLLWTSSMVRTLADNVHVVEDPKQTADDLFDD